MDPSETQAPAASIHVVPLPGSTGARTSVAAMSAYVEIVYSGVLGPSATLVYRRLCRELASHGEVTLEFGELGRGVGLKPAGVKRALKRLVDFNVASFRDGVLQLRLRLPVLSERTVARLSDEARRVHTVAIGHALVRQ